MSAISQSRDGIPESDNTDSPPQRSRGEDSCIKKNQESGFATFRLTDVRKSILMTIWLHKKVLWLRKNRCLYKTLMVICLSINMKPVIIFPSSSHMRLTNHFSKKQFCFCVGGLGNASGHQFGYPACHNGDRIGNHNLAWEGRVRVRGYR